MKTILKMLEDPESDKDELNARIWCFARDYIINEDKIRVYGNYEHSFQYSRENGKYTNWGRYRELYDHHNLYTTSLDAAMSIGREELEGWIQTAVTGVKGIECYAHIGRLKSPNKNFEIYLMELPRAICHARLSALSYVRSQNEN